MRNSLIVLSCLFLLGNEGCEQQEQVAGPKIVYTRQPAMLTPVNGYADLSHLQHAPDIAEFLRYGESDLVVDNLEGVEEVIYNCTTAPEICAAHEARVSPDGTRIAFSVAIAPDNAARWYKALIKDKTGVPWEFHQTEAHLYLYDLSAKQLTLLTTGNVDRMPDWLSDSEIIFLSDRGGVYPPLSEDGNYYDHKGLQLYKSTLTDGRLDNITNLTPHASAVISPKVMSNGEICFSSWEGHLPRKHGTEENYWPISCMDSNGANQKGELGWHGSPPLEVRAHIIDIVDKGQMGAGSTEFRGTSVVDEIFRDHRTFTNYYRRNSARGGSIMGYEAGAGEGALTSAEIEASVYKKDTAGSGRYTPSTIKLLTPWAQDQDETVRRHKNGRNLGRAGYAAAYPGDGYIYTRYRGWCYTVIRPEYTWPDFTGGEPNCKQEIHLAKQLVVTDPFDTEQTEVIACEGDEYHCWDARAIAPYSELFGIDTPTLADPIPGGKAELQVVNLFAGELWPIPGKDTEKYRVSYQGNAVPDYADRVAEFCVDIVDHHTKKPTEAGWGSRSLLGCVAPEEDGSLRIRVPADKPLLMYARDDNGETVAEDVSLHSLRPGEKRACHGCHFGHSDKLAEALGDPLEAFSKTISGVTQTTIGVTEE